MFVVAGVTGNTGSIVARTLLQGGKRVRVIVRDAAKGEPWKAQGAEIAVASVDDVEAMSSALSGAEGAYLLNPPAPAASDFLGESRKRVDALAEAARKSRIPHVVFLSSIGAQLPSGTGPIVSVHHGEAKLSGAVPNTTFLRPAYFLDNWAGVIGAARSEGVLPTFIALGQPVAQVSTQDIGRVAARSLLEGPRGRQVIELAGPEDYTPEAIAAALVKVLGREVKALPLPLEQVVPTLTSFGISGNVASLYRDLYEAIQRGHLVFEGGGASFERGRVTAVEALGAISSSLH